MVLALVPVLVLRRQRQELGPMCRRMPCMSRGTKQTNKTTKNTKSTNKLIILKNNIISLKKKMGKVQILSLLKNKQDNKEFNILLNNVISTFSNKVDKINNVLEYNKWRTIKVTNQN